MARNHTQFTDGGIYVTIVRSSLIPRVTLLRMGDPGNEARASIQNLFVSYTLSVYICKIVEKG